MNTGCQIYDKSGSYFLSFQLADWVDDFTRKVYRDIVLPCLDYCRKHTGLNLWAYFIMSNHIQAIFSAKNGNVLDIVRDFKRQTAIKILKEM